MADPLSSSRSADYPALPRGFRVFSLPRLRAFVESQSGQNLFEEPKLWVGGELVYASLDQLTQGRFWLRDQGLSLSFSLGHFPGEAPLDPVHLRLGDRVMIRVEDKRGLERAFGGGSGEPIQRARFLRLLSPREGEGLGALGPSAVSAEVVERVGRWRDFILDLRKFFASRGLMQVSSPSLVTCPGFEPSLEPFATVFRTTGGKSKALFLPTSPEIHLKKMLTQGWTDIFEIRSCYRNGELSDHHEPEFTLLEWYRAYSNLDLISEDLQELLNFLSDRGWIVGLSAKGTLPGLKTVRVAELFADYVGLPLQPDTPYASLHSCAVDLGLLHNGDRSGKLLSWSWDDLFHLLFLSQIEPRLKDQGPILVRDYPPSQAALSRINEQGWAERMELYWQGLEIANAFDELNNPQEQNLRCERDLQERKRLGTAEIPIDFEFLQSLERGMPPTGGIALGVERLFMACQGLRRIQEIKGFSYSQSDWLPD